VWSPSRYLSFDCAHISVSAMPENNFQKVLSVISSHYSECLQVIQNEILSIRFLISET
jgi:hypothetical protein